MIIETWTKEKYSKNEEEGFAARLAHEGLRVKAVRLSRLYLVEGDYAAADYKRIAGDLLLDPVSERCAPAGRRPGTKDGWRVEVWLKDSVTDVVGESVKEAVAGALGKAPSRVRFGRAYYVSGASEPALRRAVERTLVNAIVNKYSVEKARK